MKGMILVISLFMLLACALHADENKEKKIKVMPPKYNGVVLELNEASGFLEYVHNADKGEMMIYVFDKDGKSLKVNMNPKLVLFVTIDGVSSKKNLTSAHLEKDLKEADVFIIKDDVLKNKSLTGRIAIKIGENDFQASLTTDTQAEKRKREKEVKAEEEALKKSEAEKK